MVLLRGHPVISLFIQDIWTQFTHRKNSEKSHWLSAPEEN